MPLPAGFKVNGSGIAKVRIPISPRAKKIMTLLDKLPVGDVLTSTELRARVGMSVNGDLYQIAEIQNYCEKVDNKLFWGSRTSIAQLREQLAEQETTDEN